jgi:hypothetical protein
MAEIINELPIGHSIFDPYQVDLKSKKIFGKESKMNWVGKPLLDSLLNPCFEQLNIEKEVFTKTEKVIILNCIDFLYGHTLLKLLNAQKHLEEDKTYGLIVIIPKFLRWLVSDGVAEIWTVDISLKGGQIYWKELENFIRKEIKRFDIVYLSPAWSHPRKFNIEKFTRVSPYVLTKQRDDINITFIWREDRVLCNEFLFKILRKLKMPFVYLAHQNRKIIGIFKSIKKNYPQANFFVAGLGKKTSFPKWISDCRVDKYTIQNERDACELYAKSNIVIGVHGSNMLLPSAHALMTLDLMPFDRSGNITQDILFQEDDVPFASFRYRYLPLETSKTRISHEVSSMLHSYPFHYLRKK